MEQLDLLIHEDIVSGNHSLDDVIETKNSIELFDYIVDTAQGELTLFSLREYHAILIKQTKDANYCFAGQFNVWLGQIMMSELMCI